MATFAAKLCRTVESRSTEPEGYQFNETTDFENKYRHLFQKKKISTGIVIFITA
jgi:hypothetical protein